MNTIFVTSIDARKLGETLGKTVWPSVYPLIIDAVFTPKSAEWAICMRYADKEASKIMDEQAEIDSNIINLYNFA